MPTLAKASRQVVLPHASEEAAREAPAASWGMLWGEGKKGSTHCHRDLTLSPTPNSSQQAIAVTLWLGGGGGVPSLSSSGSGSTYSLHHLLLCWELWQEAGLVEKEPPCQVGSPSFPACVLVGAELGLHHRGVPFPPPSARVPSTTESSAGNLQGVAGYSWRKGVTLMWGAQPSLAWPTCLLRS